MNCTDCGATPERQPRIAEPNAAERMILALVTTEPRTPAQIKAAAFPGKPAVQTVRDILGRLHDKGLVATAQNPAHPGVTAWVRA